MVPRLGLLGPHSAVGNMSDCRSRGREFDPGQSHNFMENDHEIISTVIVLPFVDLRRAVVSDKRKYVHEVLVNGLSQACPGKKMRLGELTVST